jgi:hypothetical protein
MHPGLAEKCSRLEAEIKQARKQGDIPARLAAGAAAIAELEAAAAGAPVVAREAPLKLAMRIGYNVAADVYPGWEPGVARTEAELEAAQMLARQSAGFVAQLGLGPMQRGNAVWLLGALDLALGNRGAASAAFAQAAEIFAPLPEMRLMALGYAAIAGGGDGLEEILAALGALGTEDAGETREQLLTARAIFQN